MKKSILQGLFICITILSTASLNSQITIPPTNPDISVVGRHLVMDNKDISFDWPAVSISANFTGTSISIIMDDSKKNYYNVYIDDIFQKVIAVDSEQTIVLADDLENSPHSFRITKRTEGEQGTATFKGIILNEDAKLLPQAKKTGPKIEFIGNSITCGYGTEAASGNENFLPETENAEQSYAAIIGRHYNAEYHMISHSGQGVVRNYGDKKQISGYSMPDRYKQVFDLAKEPLWDFTSWTPDIVVINLGTNDFSTEPHPNKAVFNKKYNELVNFIRQQYGNIPIFCIVGPMTDEPCYSYVKNMVDGNRNFLNDKNIYFIGIPPYLLVKTEDYGAHWHPNYSGQTKMAHHVLPVISAVTGWE